MWEPSPVSGETMGTLCFIVPWTITLWFWYLASRIFYESSIQFRSFFLNHQKQPLSTVDDLPRTARQVDLSGAGRRCHGWLGPDVAEHLGGQHWNSDFFLRYIKNNVFCYWIPIVDDKKRKDLCPNVSKTVKWYIIWPWIRKFSLMFSGRSWNIVLQGFWPDAVAKSTERRPEGWALTYASPSAIFKKDSRRLRQKGKVVEKMGEILKVTQG